jgi:type I restriction enzyme S subunit
MSWPIAQLGQICQTTSGGTPLRSRAEYFGGTIPWVKSGDLTDGDIISCEENITESGLYNSSAKLFPKGTVLVAMYGATVGKLGILGMEAATNQAVCGITPPPELHRKFLFYFLLARRQKLIAMSTGGAQPNISQRIIRELRVPVPPILEQHRIVDILSRADGIIRLRREAGKKATELIPALFTDMFGDPATNPKGWIISTIGDVISSADYGSSTKASDGGIGLPLIRMGNVGYRGDLDLADLKFVDLPPEEVERYRLVGGDILFNRTNSKELVGKTGLWDGSCEAVVASYFIRVRVQRHKVNPFYVWAFMNSAHMKRVLFDTARGAIGQANINSKELRAFRIGLPPITMQDDFERHCRDVSDIQMQQSTATQKAAATFDILLARFFSPSLAGGQPYQ